MAWKRMKIACAAIPFLLLLSCGTDPRGYNDDTDFRRFRITGMGASPESTYLAFPPTDDSGCDGIPDTGDVGEGDYWPDLFCQPGEQIIGWADHDHVDIEVQQFARVTEGDTTDCSDPSYNLYIEKVIIDAYDDEGRQHSFAPRLVHDWMGGSLLQVGDTNTMTGLPLTRDSFKNLDLLQAMNAAGVAQGPLWTWHFVITVVAHDNYGHSYYDTGTITFVLHNPMYMF